MKKTYWLWAVFALASAAAVAKEPCPDKIRVTFPDHEVTPLFSGQGIEFASSPGLLVDWVRAAVAGTGCPTQIELKRRPFKRGFQEIEYAETDILAVVAHNAEREKLLEFPYKNGVVDKRLAYFINRSSFWVRKGENVVHWNGKTLSGPAGFKLGVPRGTTFETQALKNGWEIDVGSNGPNVLEKLLVGRTPVVLLADITVHAMDDAREALLERLNPSFEQSYYFNASSKAFHTRYPEFMGRYWLALCKVARADKTLPDQKQLPPCPSGK